MVETKIMMIEVTQPFSERICYLLHLICWSCTKIFPLYSGTLSMAEKEKMEISNESDRVIVTSSTIPLVVIRRWYALALRVTTNSFCKDYIAY